MTTTRINHTGHNHPSTTAARTACRKAMAADVTTARTVPTARVGNGNALHIAMLADTDKGPVLTGVYCGAGLSRGVRRTSALYRQGDAPVADITCPRCMKVENRPAR